MAEIEGQVKDEELDAEQQARRQLALAQIRQYPDAALKMAARPVEEFDDDLRRLVDRMKQLMVDASGIGLAATQVGVLQRLFVFQVAEDETVALANPEIVERGEETTVEDEGCLSIQGVLLPVERSAKIAVEDQDAVEQHELRLGEAWQALAEQVEDPAEFAGGWRKLAGNWDFATVNDLIERHNRNFPAEARLAMDPRTRDFVRVNGRSYLREPFDAQWILDRFPPDRAAAVAA